jgi:hypothetical protein
MTTRSVIRDADGNVSAVRYTTENRDGSHTDVDYAARAGLIGIDVSTKIISITDHPPDGTSKSYNGVENLLGHPVRTSEK